MNVELQTLENYIRLEQLRFAFTYELIIAETINAVTREIPSLLLQPLIENAIKHGISSLQKSGKISIDMYAKEKNLLIQIQDNGNGFYLETESKGFGLPLTRERIKLINQSLKEQKIQLNIATGATGTTVLLTFENWL